jgi:hypothetical protein
MTRLLGLDKVIGTDRNARRNYLSAPVRDEAACKKITVAPAMTGSRRTPVRSPRLMLRALNGMVLGAPHLEITICDLKTRSAMTTPTALPAEVTHASRVSVHEIRGERVVLDQEVARLFGAASSTWFFLGRTFRRGLPCASSAALTSLAILPRSKASSVANFSSVAC